MGKFLGKEEIIFVLVCFLSAMITYSFLIVSNTYAANYNATMTGYAHAYNLGSASGADLVAGHFANHPAGACASVGGDPAASWGWNTQIIIVNPSSVPFRFSNNSSYSRTSFIKKDRGDPNCTKGKYWADIYFSHAKHPISGCRCGGFTSCTLGSNNVNNCDQAVDWGSSTRTYSGP